MGLEGVQNYMIGVILFVVVITSGVFVIGNFYSSDVSIDSGNQIGQFNRSLSKASEVTTSVNELQSGIVNVNEEDAGVLGWLNSLVGSIFRGLKAIFGTLSFMNVAADETASLFGMPTFIFPLILLIVTVIIGFAIYSAITKV
jgi:hypothetical protein